MDWFQPWPREALVSVARHFLAKFDIICEDSVKECLVECMGQVHDAVSTVCLEYFARLVYVFTSF